MQGSRVVCAGHRTRTVCLPFQDFRPAAYDGPEPGIRALLEGMSRFGWQPIEERGLPIAAEREGRTITLEPGGQFELSGAAFGDVHQTLQETQAYHQELESTG